MVRRGVALGLVLCGGVGSLASCALVAGLGDYELAPADASAPDGASEAGVRDAVPDRPEATTPADAGLDGVHEASPG